MELSETVVFLPIETTKRDEFDRRDEVNLGKTITSKEGFSPPEAQRGQKCIVTRGAHCENEK